MIKQITIAFVSVFFLAFEIKDRPTIYLIGDSTVKNSNQQYWGWGSLLGEFLDTTAIAVSNHAMAGRSTRTFRKEGRWNRVKESMRPGDYLLIQFGHNEGSNPDTTRQGYRGVLRGIGQDSVVLDWGEGEKETVRTYGENLRRFVREAKQIGAHPIILSMIPRNQWDEQGRTKRANQDFGLWAQLVAEAEQIPFIDLNEITAKKYDKIGAKQVKEKYFPGDHTHTNYEGAMENAASVVEGLSNIQHPLVKYIK